jgi:hypothetical protein
MKKKKKPPPKPYFGQPPRKLIPQPNIEDWKVYLKSVQRNGTEWGAK